MGNRNVWFAKDAITKIQGFIASVNGATSLESQVTATGTWTSRIKNAKIELGDRDISPINVMGVQQLKQEDRPAIVSAVFSTVFYGQGSTGANAFFDFMNGQGTAVGATGYNRYQGGEKLSNDRTELAVLIKMTRPGAAVSDTVTFLLNRANVTAGPVTLDGEGHAEQEITVKCLAGDFYWDTGITADPAT